MRPEDKTKTLLVPRYLKQETINKRGISTCYVTSILNAAISLGSLSLEIAQLYHDAIIDELLSDPSVWNGSLMRIDALNPKIAEVIEQYMPVEIGVKSEIGRLLTVTRNFEQIQRDLQTQKQAHVLIVRETVHAYAVIGATPHELVYVDPFDPYSRFFASKKNFERIFHPDTFGEVFTTPVRRRESKRKGL